MNKNYYITTTLPYVNALPHMGFALEIIQADILARYNERLGNTVFFNFGTDEHGQKIYQKAVASGKPPQDYVDEFAAKFDDLKIALNLSYNNFIRTTDAHHKKAAQEIWIRCRDNGYIEKGIYKTKYCIGCELEKQDSDLQDGKCPLHPTYEIQYIEEENYFFKFSKLQLKLLDLYQANENFVVPKHRYTEIINFVKSGLNDFSISRQKEKMPWGIEVPDDNKHVMYVWFDALTNYISALGWPENTSKFNDYWGSIANPNAIQIAGKDNLRQQSSMWQAMLLAAGLPPTKQIIIHGFITSGGQKMSKSLGNVINPFEYVDTYGTDAVRYYLVSKINPFEDSDFTKESFELTYQADLANGLGNLVSRVSKMCETQGVVANSHNDLKFSPLIVNHLTSYRFDMAIKTIWDSIKKTDMWINDNKVWELTGEEKNKALSYLVGIILQITYDLYPFMPETADKIKKQFTSDSIKLSNPLFPRL
ncbi:methionine--tRNA ligase [Candidatus Woesebacteria bacterium]|nr:MAG: methionine--tRNA ligase [Candidatus Woesebacteria bacterium]